METKKQLLVVGLVLLILLSAFVFNWRRDLQRQRETPEQRASQASVVAERVGMVFFALTIIGPIVHILIGKTGIIETFLLYFLVVRVGLGGLWGFNGHFFYADQVAAYIGWPAGNPFQKEIAFTNLAFGTLGVLCIWLGGNFWVATVIGVSIFLLGAAFVHFQDISISQNFNPGNAGSVLVSDILNPLILCILLIAHRWQGAIMGGRE